MHTDTLRYERPRLASPPPRATCGSISGSHTLTAHGLSANLKERTMRLESKVNGRFQP